MFSNHLIIALDFFVFALVLTEEREIVELFGDIRVITAQDSLPDFQGALAKRLSLAIFTAFSV